MCSSRGRGQLRARGTRCSSLCVAVCPQWPEYSSDRLRRHSGSAGQRRHGRRIDAPCRHRAIRGEGSQVATARCSSPTKWHARLSVAAQSNWICGLRSRRICCASTISQSSQAIQARSSAWRRCLRWRHPVYGDMSPADFIPIAENAGLLPCARRMGAQPCHGGFEALASSRDRIEPFAGAVSSRRPRNNLAQARCRNMTWIRAASSSK